MVWASLNTGMTSPTELEDAVCVDAVSVIDCLFHAGKGGFGGGSFGGGMGGGGFSGGGGSFGGGGAGGSW